MIEYIIVVTAFAVATFFTVYKKAFEVSHKREMTWIQVIVSFLAWTVAVAVLAPILGTAYFARGHDFMYDSVLNSLEESLKK